jgi:hypothetical protein
MSRFGRRRRGWRAGALSSSASVGEWASTSMAIPTGGLRQETVGRRTSLPVKAAAWVIEVEQSGVRLEPTTQGLGVWTLISYPVLAGVVSCRCVRVRPVAASALCRPVSPHVNRTPPTTRLSGRGHSGKSDDLGDGYVFGGRDCARWRGSWECRRWKVPCHEEAAPMLEGMSASARCVTLGSAKRGGRFVRECARRTIASAALSGLAIRGRGAGKVASRPSTQTRPRAPSVVLKCTDVFGCTCRRSQPITKTGARQPPRRWLGLTDRWAGMVDSWVCRFPGMSNWSAA